MKMGHLPSDNVQQAGSDGLLCAVCELPGVSSFTCVTCSKIIHKEDCSEGIAGNNDDKRLCMKCLRTADTTLPSTKKPRLSLGIHGTTIRFNHRLSTSSTNCDNTSGAVEPEVIDLVDDDEEDFTFSPQPPLKQEIDLDVSSGGGVTAHSSENVLAANLTSGCPACANGHTPSAHKCFLCGKAVHMFPQCSCALENEEEGYGERRVCLNCAEQSDSNPSVSCCVCSEDVSKEEILTCTVCEAVIHLATTCSVPDPEHIKEGRAKENVRVCRLCLCSMCKRPRRDPHECQCVVCQGASGTMALCANCQQPTHVDCKSPDVGWCYKCLYSKDFGLSMDDVRTLQSDDMLTETVICCGMNLLKSQFPAFFGLQIPISSEKVLTRWPEPGEEHHSYLPSTKAGPYLQILNTGSQHWITAFKPQGSDSNILVLNSSGSIHVGSFVEQQLALIMNSQRPRFIITHMEVQQQGSSINECGPLALAFATEIAHTKAVSYVEFKLDELRPHLLKCIVSGKIEPFPRQGIARKSKVLSKDSVEVMCTCRLPQHHDEKAVYCSKCRRWCHFKCHGLNEEPTSRRWVCKSCSK